MKIAIIAWGSLYWEPGELSISSEWYFDGPMIPLEFARISSGNRLTLVIKPDYEKVKTLYAFSAYTTISDARENVRIREKTDNIDNIGYIDFTSNDFVVRPANLFILDILKDWNENKGFDAIIWSDFSPLFSDKIHLAFTIENVISFLEGLPPTEKHNALEYIMKAPTQIDTRFRKAIMQNFNIKKPSMTPLANTSIKKFSLSKFQKIVTFIFVVLFGGIAYVSQFTGYTFKDFKTKMAATDSTIKESPLTTIETVSPTHKINMPFNIPIALRTRALDLTEISYLNRDQNSAYSENINKETYITSIERDSYIQLIGQENNFYKIKVSIEGKIVTGFISKTYGGETTIIPLTKKTPQVGG